MKLGAAGDTVWSRVLGGTQNDTARSVEACPGGGCVVVGETGSFGAGGEDMWLVRFGADGDTLWSMTLGGEEDEEGRSVKLTADNGFIVCGATESFGANRADGYVVRLAPETGIAEAEPLPIPGPVMLVARSTLKLSDGETGRLFDAAGRMAAVLRPGENDFSQLRAGAYYLRPDTGGTGRILLVR